MQHRESAYDESSGRTGGPQYLEDQIKLTVLAFGDGGIRRTHYSADVVENASSPRVGASLRVPKLNWVFRAFYGHFYQAPPLLDDFPGHCWTPRPTRIWDSFRCTASATRSTSTASPFPYRGWDGSMLILF